jgi:N-acetylglucosamine kinase-like BadF-type ATPase
MGATSGDWGGGGDLAREMIRLVMRAWDGRGQPTLLTRLVLENLQAPSVESLLVKLYHGEIDGQRKLELVPLLFRAGEAGDEAACELIVRAGTEIGITARTLIRRLGLEREEVEVILGGGVFKGGSRLLIDTITEVVHEQAPRARVVPLKHEPVVGAALLALESMHVVVDDSICQNLESTLPGLLRIPGPGPEPGAVCPAHAGPE